MGAIAGDRGLSGEEAAVVVVHREVHRLPCLRHRAGADGRGKGGRRLPAEASAHAQVA